MSQKTFYILRHGEIYSGSWWWWRITRLASIDRDDPPLSPFGMEKSKVLGQKISADGFVPEAIVVSPYIRCIQTATQIQKSLKPTPKIIIEPLLAEYQFLLKQTCATYPEGLPFGSPETFDMLVDRCTIVANEIIKKYDKAIFITHGSLVCFFANYFSGLPADANVTIKFSDYIKVIQDKKYSDKYNVEVINW